MQFQNRISTVSILAKTHHLKNPGHRDKQQSDVTMIAETSLNSSGGKKMNDGRVMFNQHFAGLTTYILLQYNIMW
jgi:hypothetical protein